MIIKYSICSNAVEDQEALPPSIHLIVIVVLREHACKKRKNLNWHLQLWGSSLHPPQNLQPNAPPPSTTAPSTSFLHRLLARLFFLRCLRPCTRPRPLLPPPSDPSKPTVFLDLDNTLVHAWRADSSSRRRRHDFVVEAPLEGKTVRFHVVRRPGVRDLLSELQRRGFEVVVFTAGVEGYASQIVDRLDPTGNLITHRLYRDSCREENGRLLKDLTLAGRDLRRVVIVDNNPQSYTLHPENVVPVSSFSNDAPDQELFALKRFFEIATLFEDMRDAIKYYFSQVGEEEEAQPSTTASGHGKPKKGSYDYLDVTFTGKKARKPSWARFYP